MEYFQFMSKFTLEIKYAHATTAFADNRGVVFTDQSKNTIEFCVNNSNTDLVIQTEEETILFKPNDFVLLFPNKKYSIRPDGPQSVACTDALYIIAAEVTECQYLLCNTEQINTLPRDATEAGATQWIFLPKRQNLNESQYRNVTKLMRTIIKHFDNVSAYRSEYVFCIAKWFELAALLDQTVRAELHYDSSGGEKLKPNVDYYVSKTKKYIEQHYAEHITIPDVAQSVGISPNYISALFKEGTGYTIITYLNYFRMLRLKELLQSDADQCFEDLCNRIGISDERYARRLFKKHFGVSIQQYRQLGYNIAVSYTNAMGNKEAVGGVYQNTEQIDSQMRCI